MSYELTISGQRILCETLGDLKALLLDPAFNSQAHRTTNDESSLSAIDPEAMAALRDVGPEGRTLLKFIAAAPDASRTDEEVRDAMGKNNKGIAAVVANVSKASKAHGIEYIVKSSARFRAGSRTYVFSISQAVAAAIRAMGDRY